MTTMIERFKERFEWVQVKAPKPWRPAATGEELCGYYAGRTLRQGAHGQYEVVLVAVPREGLVTASGTELIRLLDAAAIQRGHPLRTLFKGWKATTDGKRLYRAFDLLVALGDPIPEREMPSFSEVSDYMAEAKAEAETQAEDRRGW